jgi:hypothetical protein
MSESAVADASPLIYLARAQFLHLLQLAAPEVFIPSSVGCWCSAGSNHSSIRHPTTRPTERPNDPFVAWSPGGWAMKRLEQ